MKKRCFIFFLCFSSLLKAQALSDNLNSNPDSANYYLSKAKESKLARKIFDAERFFQKSLVFDPNSPITRLEFAQYYIDQRKYAFAGQQLTSILQKEPTHNEAINKIIEVSFIQKKWKETIQYGEFAVQNNIKVSRINYMLARAYFEDENYGKARKLLNTQIQETPTDKETIRLLGKVYVELSLYNDAIVMYKKALDHATNDVELMYEVALLYSAQNNDKDAVRYFELAAEKGIKQDLVFLENFGMSYLSFDIKKGVEVLNKVLEKKPGDVEILTQIAQAYYKAEQYATAHELFFKMFENDNTNIKALYMSGIALIKKGDKTKGSQICDKAIAMDPKLADLRTQKSVL
jgi:tetratricopeptide (TPR) repeat protein